MGIATTKAITAQDQWSSRFQLQGDDAVMGARRALVNINGGSTITVRRLSENSDAATVLSSKTLTETGVLEVPVTGIYQVGCATGDYVDATTVVVEQ